MSLANSSRLGNVFLFLVLSAATTNAHASECAAVYANSTRNVTEAYRQQTELSYFFSLHCSKSGEVNQSSLGIGLEATVKQIPYKFSLTSTDAKTKMEEFCKVGAQQNFFSSTATDVRNEVVVAALRSFNECIALERRGLRLTHQEQPPRSVLIFGEQTNAYTAASLDAITYDPKLVSCRSTGFSKDGSAITLDGSKSLKITQNFTITCTRKGNPAPKSTVYPRTTIGVSTSLGPYTVDLIEDELYGFELASQSKALYGKALADRNQALIDAAASKEVANQLQARLNNVSVEFHTISTGERDVGSTAYYQPRLYCYTDVNAHAQSVCGPDRQLKLVHVGGNGGHKCGYQHYIFACISK